MSPILLAADVWWFLFPLFGTAMVLIAIFLILLVLVQRGRGGGLTGALGGMGGQSAFGTKAGDTFTRVTIGAAVVWILLCVASIRLLNGTSSLAGGIGDSSSGAPAIGTGEDDKDKDKDADKNKKKKE